MRAAAEDDRARPAIGGRTAVLVAAAAVALPVLVTTYPPMIDLPLHEGAIALLRNWGNPNVVPPGIYRLNLGHSGQLFHVVAAALACVMSVERATLVEVAACLAGIVIGAARLAEHVGASAWSALLVVGAALGWTFFSGFAPNLLALAIFLVALPALDRGADTPSPASCFASAAWLVLLHFAHETGFLLGAFAIAIFALVRPLDRQLWLRLLPLVPGTTLAAFDVEVPASDLTPFAAHWTGVRWNSITDKLSHADDFLLGPGEGFGALAARLLLAAALIAMAWNARVRLATLPRGGLGDRLHSARWGLLALTFGVVYIAAPYSINFGVFLYARFLAPAFVIGVVSLAPRAAPRPPPGWTRALWSASAGAVVLSWIPAFIVADGNARDLDAVFGHARPGVAAVVLPIFRDPRNELYLSTAASRILALRGGRTLHSLCDYPNAPVVMRPEARWDEAVERVAFDGPSFLPDFDLRRFSEIVVYVPDPSLQGLVAEAFAPEATLAATGGRWMFFASTLPIDPIAAAAPSPTSLGSTLQKRITAAQRRAAATPRPP